MLISRKSNSNIFNLNLRMLGVFHGDFIIFMSASRILDLSIMLPIKLGCSLLHKTVLNEFLALQYIVKPCDVKEI